jgi:flagellar biosynthesis protein FlhG
VITDQAAGLRKMMAAPTTPAAIGSFASPAAGARSGDSGALVRPQLRGRSLAVVSGKGGVGKTFVATSLAVLAARRGKRVLVIDADVGLANVDVILRTRPRYGIDDALAGRCALIEAIEHSDEGVEVLAATNGRSAPAKLDDDARRSLPNVIEQLGERYALVIIDCGAGVGDDVQFWSSLAESRVVVVTPEPTALVDAYTMTKALAERGAAKPIDVVVNCATDAEGAECFRRLDAVAARFLAAPLRFVGAVPRDDHVRAAVMARRPVVSSAPRSNATRALERIDQRIDDDAKERT